jgi:hypothetical protein
MLKFARLTKEQFEEMHQEFINFLSAQSIASSEWEQIKKEQPQVAEQELDVFSDLIWQGVLQKVQYLENISRQQMFLFKCESKLMRVIVIQIENELVDITTKIGYQWLQKNLMQDSVKFLNGTKPYTSDPLQDKFQLIQQGAVITKGELFEYFEKLLK